MCFRFFVGNLGFPVGLVFCNEMCMGGCGYIGSERGLGVLRWFIVVGLYCDCSVIYINDRFVGVLI